jgi:ABC-type uncharacterized transport system fused permease/ATPase subunit
MSQRKVVHSFSLATSPQEVTSLLLPTTSVSSQPQSRSRQRWRTLQELRWNVQRRTSRLFDTTTDNHDDSDDELHTRSTTTTTNTRTSSIPTDGLMADPSRNKNIDWNRVREQATVFRELATPYYTESAAAKRLLAGVLVLTLANSGISVLFSYLGKDFWNALSDVSDTSVFYDVLTKYVGALIVGAPVVTLYKYQREQLAVHWREWMTARTFDLYSNHRVYYNLPDVIDNPDQRITEDVRSFTSFSLSLLITVLTSVIDLCSFSVILWSIYPQLFIAIILYATFGTIVTTYLGRSLIPLNFAQLRFEADLRYSLVRIRDNAESIAFYAGEDIEGQFVEKNLEKTMQNRRFLNAAQRNLEFFTNAYRYLVQILPIAVVAPRYFAGEVGLGVISQSAGAFNHILGDLSIIVNQFEQLSSFSAGIERLSSFYDAMKTVNTTTADATMPAIEVPTETEMISRNTSLSFSDTATTHVDKEHFGTINLQRWETSRRLALDISDLDLVTPDRKRVLIRNLNLQLPENQHLLIVGNSGAGKSSLLRAIAGLWTAGNGSIGRPADETVYFLPQRPYCMIGTLKDQLLYPSLSFRSEAEIMTTDHSKTFGNNAPDAENRIIPKSHWLKQTLTDADLLEILKQVDLLDVATRAGDGDPVLGLYASLDWSNILSLGEQQRLAFGRVLVNRPRLVIVDEATSALDIEAEARMYGLLQSMARGNSVDDGNTLSGSSLTYISVGHRPSLLTFHDQKLRLGGLSDHELENIPRTKLEVSTPSNM